jgi:DNA-binding PadR family transcriptional regulator
MVARSTTPKPLSPVELATLVVLSTSPAHGYEISRRLQVAFGEIGRFSYGSIYPALARLHRGGLISPVGGVGKLDPSRLPGVLAAELVLAASAVGGRVRRTYRITAEGRERLTAELAHVDASDDRLSTIALVAARLLDDAAVRALALARRRLLTERLGELEQLEREAPQLALQTVRARLRAELKTLERLGEHARQGT